MNPEEASVPARSHAGVESLAVEVAALVEQRSLGELPPLLAAAVRRHTGVRRVVLCVRQAGGRQPWWVADPAPEIRAGWTRDLEALLASGKANGFHAEAARLPTDSPERRLLAREGNSGLLILPLRRTGRWEGLALLFGVDGEAAARELAAGLKALLPQLAWVVAEAACRDQLQAIGETSPLERALRQRARELEQANEELRRARLATLNMMEDALAAREGLEELNARYRREVEERRRIEQELQAQVDRMNQLLDTTMDGYILADTQGRIIDVNPAYCQMIGWSRQELLRMTIFDVEAMLTPPQIEEKIREMVSAGSARFETRHRRRDGRVIDLDVSITIIRRKPSDLVAAFVRDITATRRTLRALAESEERWRNLFELSAVGRATVSLQGRFLQVNRTFADMLGYEREELLRLTWMQLTHPEDLEQGLMFFQAAVSGAVSSFRYEHRLCRKDGSACWVDLSVVLMRDADGRPAYASADVVDVTERREAAESIRRAAEEWEVTFNSTRDAILLVDRAGRVLRANRAAGSLFGVSGDALTGRSGCEVLHPGVPHPEGCPFAGPLRRSESRSVTLGWRDRWLEIMTYPVWDDQRPWLGGIHVIRDITESRRNEEERERMRAQLEQAQKLEAIGRLAGGVAHDFNNLLTGILHHVELAREQLPPDHPARNHLREIDEGAQRSARVVSQLLGYARRQLIQPQRLDLNETLVPMLNLLRRLLGENIELRWNPGRDLWPVLMDPGQLDQILTNLCVNARDALPERGGWIEVATANRTVAEAEADPARGKLPGEYVCLAVRDNGCGIRPEHLDRIFEPFFTTKGEGQGTGLGLANVYGIVRQNGGFIEIDSEVGKGTTFRIAFPRFTGAEAPRATPDTESMASADRTSPTQEGPRGRILLVEDERSLRVTTRIFLERHGYEVLVAETPEEALRLARECEGPIDLLLTDVVMPGMSGKDLAEQLKAERPQMACLFMSGYTEDIVAEAGVVEEGTQFLPKPFDRRKLIRRIERILRPPAG